MSSEVCMIGKIENVPNPVNDLIKGMVNDIVNNVANQKKKADENNDASYHIGLDNINNKLEDDITHNIEQNMFKKVLTTPFYNKHKGESRLITYVDDENKIKYPDEPYLCEAVGLDYQQVKPYFDFDYKLNATENQEDVKKIEEMHRKSCYSLIEKWFEDYDVQIFEGKKNPRVFGDSEEYIKLSLRFYVRGVRISNTNILPFLASKGVDTNQNNAPFDFGVYNQGRILLLPYSSKPRTTRDSSQTVLYPVKKNNICSVFDYCATYIQQDYEDLDLLFTGKKNTSAKDSHQNTYCNDVNKDIFQKMEEALYLVDNKDEVLGCCKKIVKQFDEKMADDHAIWVKVCIALKSIGEKYNSHYKTKILFHNFSSKSGKYDEEENEKLYEDVKISKDKNIGLPTLKKMLYMYVENANDFEKKKYNNFKKKIEKTTCKLLSKPVIIRENAFGDVVFYRQGDYAQCFGHIKCFIYDASKDDWVKVPFVVTWFDDENIRTFEKIDCIPYGPTPPHIYNTWKGFRAEKLPPIDDSLVDELVEPIIHHIKEVITGEDNFWFLRDWLMNIVQRPDRKSGVAVIIKGEQGTGKDIIFDWFYQNVLSKDCASQVCGIAEIFDRFDNSLVNKVFCLCDEINIKEFQGTIGERFKNLITSTTVRFEEKGIMKVDTTNMINLLATSNNDNPIPIPFDDRRCYVEQTRNVYKKNTAYFNKLAKHLEDDRVVRAFYQYLMKGDIRHIHNFQNIRPLTPYYQEMKRCNLPVLYRFLSWLCDNTFTFINEDKIVGYKGKQLYDKYVNWIKDRNYTFTSNSTIFGKDLKKIIEYDSDIVNKKVSNVVK